MPNLSRSQRGISGLKSNPMRVDWSNPTTAAMLSCCPLSELGSQTYDVVNGLIANNLSLEGDEWQPYARHDRLRGPCLVTPSLNGSRGTTALTIFPRFHAGPGGSPVKGDFSFRMIHSPSTGGSPTGTLYVESGTSDTAVDFAIVVDQHGNVNDTFIAGGGTSTSFATAMTDVNKSYDLVMTRVAGEITYYIDGVAIGSAFGGTNTLTSAAKAISVGHGTDSGLGASRGYSGRIALVQFWARGLRPDEVRRVAERPLEMFAQSAPRRLVPVVPSTVSGTTSGVASAERVGSGVSAPASAVHGSGVASAELVGDGAASVVYVISGSGVASSERVGSSGSTSSATISGGGVAAAESVGVGVATAMILATVQGYGVASSELAGSGSSAMTIAATTCGVDSAELVGSAPAIQGDGVMGFGVAPAELVGMGVTSAGTPSSGSGVTSDETVGAGVLSATSSAAGSGVLSSERVGEPGLAAFTGSGFFSAGILSAELVGCATATTLYPVVGVGVGSAERVGTGVAGGSAPVAGRGIPSGERPGASAIATRVAASGVGVGSAERVGSGVLASPRLFAASWGRPASFGSPTITAAGTIAPGSFSGRASFPTIAAKAAAPTPTFDPARFSGSGFFRDQFTGGQVDLAGHVSDTNNDWLYPASAAGGFSLTGGNGVVVSGDMPAIAVSDAVVPPDDEYAVTLTVTRLSASGQLGPLAHAQTNLDLVGLDPGTPGVAVLASLWGYYDSAADTYNLGFVNATGGHVVASRAAGLAIGSSAILTISAKAGATINLAVGPEIVLSYVSATSPTPPTVAAPAGNSQLGLYGVGSSDGVSTGLVGSVMFGTASSFVGGTQADVSSWLAQVLKASGVAAVAFASIEDTPYPYSGYPIAVVDPGSADAEDSLVRGLGRTYDAERFGFRLRLIDRASSDQAARDSDALLGGSGIDRLARRVFDLLQASFPVDQYGNYYTREPLLVTRGQAATQAYPRNRELRYVDLSGSVPLAAPMTRID